ncbi:MAG: hypothetical protein LLF75_06635 [Eubacteriales bacterium]|nr:hypothetical protein [Eubacteriales bacterium]
MSLICSEVELCEAARAISSALMKSEKVLLKVREGSPQHRLTAENIRAFQIALALIRHEQGAQGAFAFDKDELLRAREAFDSVRSRVEKILPKFAAGTPQHTLAVRRIRAFEIAVCLIQRYLENKS